MTPLESAARVLCEIDGRDPDEVCIGEGHATGQTWMGWEAFVSHARKVIAAIREPSEEMREAAFQIDVEFRTVMGNLDRGFCDGEGVWQAMVDTMLTERLTIDR